MNNIIRTSGFSWSGEKDQEEKNVTKEREEKKSVTLKSV